MSDKPTAEDLRVIENQLGRKPRDVHRVSFRCPDRKSDVCSSDLISATNSIK